METEFSSFGVRSLDSYVRKQGFDSEVIFLTRPPACKVHPSLIEDVKFNQSLLDEIVARCSTADIIGLSLFSCDLKKALQISGILKQHIDSPIVWGGKHPSAMPEFTLRTADIVALGESEIPLVNLLKRLEAGKEYTDVKGFWFKKDGSIIKNDPGDMIHDLDDIPCTEFFTDQHFVCDPEYKKLIQVDAATFIQFVPPKPNTNHRSYLIMASRGCPYNCTYCFTFKGLYKNQRYVRRRSVNHMLSELKSLKEKWGEEIKHISFADDEFLTADRAYLEEFCRRYKEEIGLPFHCLGHPHNTTQDIIELLLDAGMVNFQMGIQTCSDNTRKLFNRTVSNEKVLKAVTTLNQYKDCLLPAYDFIVDIPYEDLSDTGETLRTIVEFPRPFTLTVFSLVFFPGTRLYQRAIEDGLIDPDDINTYTKKYQDYTKRYSNILFMLLMNNTLPRSLMRVLASDIMLRCFDRPFFTSILTKIHKIWQLRKR